MLLCFSGAHRTGKTTLAKEMTKHGFSYVNAGVSDAIRAVGFNLNDIMNMPNNIDKMIKIRDMQSYIAKLINHNMNCLLADTSTKYVMDRSIYDVIGYTMHYIQSFIADHWVEVGYEVMRDIIFSGDVYKDNPGLKIVVVPPMIDFVNDPTKNTAPEWTVKDVAWHIEDVVNLHHPKRLLITELNLDKRVEEVIKWLGI